jgi:hypothetical protein
MKKLLCSLLALFVLAQPLAFAGFIGGSSQVVKTTAVNYTGTANRIDDSPTSATSAAILTEDADRVIVFVTYDETQAGTATGTFSIEVSWDGATWLAGYSFYDIAGGATAQTSEVFTADTALYVCWLGENTIPPYIRVKMTGTASDADDILEGYIYVYKHKG